MNNINYLDKTLEVKIDRPLGSKHPKHSFIYPINYGGISSDSYINKQLCQLFEG